LLPDSELLRGYPQAARAMGDWSRRHRSKALVRDVSPRFTDALAHYFGNGPTDVAASERAHEQYVAALIDHGVEVKRLASTPDHPDCCFIEDTAVVVDDTVVICNMGHPSRAGEVEAVREALNGHLEVLRMPEGAKLDGGDVLFFDDMFLVGRSVRSNAAGVDFLTSTIRDCGYDVDVIDVPESTLHLSTVCSSPAPGMLLTPEGHLTPEQLAPLKAEGHEVVWVPNEEAYGANTIGFEGDRVIVSSDYPVTSATLEERGFTLTEVDMEHIRAADGSLTCLRLFYG